MENNVGKTTTKSSEQVKHSRYALQAVQLLEEGKFHASLQLLNICLGDTDEVETSDLESQVEDLVKSGKTQKSAEATNDASSSNEEECNTDENSLIEKRCLVNMRLKRYSKVIHDAKKMLDFSGENPVAYKCLLAALCKMKKLEQANEVIRLWQKNCPRDLDMMTCRTKLENLMVAVKNGIEASDAFSDVEDLLGLNYDWLLLRKSKDPQWKFRPLPTSSQCSFVLCLQYRFGHCSLGEKCPDAHGEAELEEWKRRFEIENVSKKLGSIRLDDGMSYVKDLLAKMQDLEIAKDLFSEDNVEQLKVSCTSPLHSTVPLKNLKKFTWTFSVRSSNPLVQIALLHDHHRQYFHISSCNIIGPKDNVLLCQPAKAEASSQVLSPHLSEAAIAIAGVANKSYNYKIKVVFTADNMYGTFRQTIVFDDGGTKKIIRNIAADVVPPPEPREGSSKSSRSENCISPVDVKASKGYRTNIPWNFGNAEMLDGNTGEKVPSERLGFALISNSKVLKSESFMENTKDPLSKEHYKERMRFLLTQEERARQEILAKYNVTTNVHLSEKYMVTGGFNEGMTRYAIDGALFGRINLFRDISEDTAVGRLILRSCNAVLLAKSEKSRKQKEGTVGKIRVYFCPISDKTKNSVFLELGKKVVSEMGLKDGKSIQLDIQFQLDRTTFLEQKKVIDQLEEKHLDMLFPDLTISTSIPWNPIKQWSESETSKYRLNPKQKEALIAITAENCKTPPILVIGPFGSGKTFTLAQCIRKILAQENTRVMVCTHSNSAADLYIKEYLDSWVKEGFTEARPLRIYYEMRNLSSVHPVVLQYCTIEAMKFRPPTYDEVLNHRVIVVTLSTSYILMEMNLPEDTFSHILLDEAAQAMESEAITPLMSAGQNTKLVLAGDHFQLSPELFSEEARNIHPSLLERLHALYNDTHPCKLMLCENYRSHSAIIQFVSESFYTKKLECAKSQPVHDNFFPLTFFAARGEDVQDSESTSYYNMAEVFELTEKISELISSWPEKWGDYRDENAIGVLTPYADQVTRIRSRLRKKGLHTVSVERVFNVQGKQFRAVFLSTVRTFRPWVRILPEAVGNEVDLGFFSSPKLLNTALTRAQSLVAVVGDPVSLCSVGKCRRIWEDYIRICHESKSLFGITFLQLKQSILGVEMRLTWGLNPLANEFQPQKSRAKGTVSSGAPASSATAPLPTVPVSTTAIVTPMSSSQNFIRSRQPRPPFLYPDPQVYYGPPQPPLYPDYGQIIPPGGPMANPAYYHGLPQPMLRPPYHGGFSLGPGLPPPQLTQPMGPWSTQGMGPTMPFLPVNAAVIAPVIGVAGRGGTPQGTGAYSATSTIPVPGSGAVHSMYTNPNVPGPAPAAVAPPPAVGSHFPPLSSTSETIPNVHNNPNNYVGKSPSFASQSHFATGQPLYRRTSSSNVSSFQSQGPPSVYPQGTATFEEHKPHYTPGAEYQSQTNQQKLTPDELSLITKALEHASAGEPFFGDIHAKAVSIRSKLMQAMSNAEAPTTTHYTGSQLTSTYPIGHSNLQSQSQAQPSLNPPTLPSSSVFTPIPQKSPMQPIGSDRVTSSYSNSFHSQDPVGVNDLRSSSYWPNSNSAFPALSEGLSGSGNNPSFNTASHTESLLQRSRGQSLLDPNSSRFSFNQQSSVVPSSIAFPSNQPLSHGLSSSSRPLPLPGFNNNTISSSDYGYHADVGNLKAQLSGGLCQGFGERSAFSRVNGGQDMEISSDSSGLGRSYANVVKAAAVTAAVGAGVTTSTMSMASSISRPQAPQLLPPTNSATPFSKPTFYSSTGMSLPLHNHFGQ